MRNRALLMGLVLAVMTACTADTEQEADGESEVEINPAPVEIQSDTNTVVVPEVDIGSDSTARDTTPR
jgi:hypothetical protein